jgi:hypothetical protein
MVTVLNHQRIFTASEVENSVIIQTVMAIPRALVGVYHKASRALPWVIHFRFTLPTQVVSRINARPLKGLLHTLCTDVVLARLVFEVACLAGLLANGTLHCWDNVKSSCKCPRKSPDIGPQW